MSILNHIAGRGIWAVAVAATASVASAATYPVLLEQNYDDTPPNSVGSLPADWSVVSGAAPGAVVQTGVPGTPSSPNVFQVQHGGGDFTIQTVSPTQVDLDANSPNLVWGGKIYVDEINSNNSAGVQFKLWNADVSNLEAGYYRVLSLSSGTFHFYNGNAGPPYNNGGLTYIGPFNLDQWYDFSIVIDPISTSAGTATLYVDGVPVNVETYTGRGTGQTTDIDTLQILSMGDGLNRIYLDDVFIAVPEPASAGLLALGALGLAVRRRKA